MIEKITLRRVGMKVKMISDGGMNRMIILIFKRLEVWDQGVKEKRLNHEILEKHEKTISTSLTGLLE